MQDPQGPGPKKKQPQAPVDPTVALEQKYGLAPALQPSGDIVLPDTPANATLDTTSALEQKYLGHTAAGAASASLGAGEPTIDRDVADVMGFGVPGVDPAERAHAEPGYQAANRVVQRLGNFVGGVGDRVVENVAHIVAPLDRAVGAEAEARWLERAGAAARERRLHPNDDTKLEAAGAGVAHGVLGAAQALTHAAGALRDVDVTALPSAAIFPAVFAKGASALLHRPLAAAEAGLKGARERIIEETPLRNWRELGAFMGGEMAGTMVPYVLSGGLGGSAKGLGKVTQFALNEAKVAPINIAYASDRETSQTEVFAKGLRLLGEKWKDPRVTAASEWLERRAESTPERIATDLGLFGAMSAGVEGVFTGVRAASHPIESAANAVDALSRVPGSLARGARALGSGAAGAARGATRLGSNAFERTATTLFGESSEQAFQRRLAAIRAQGSHELPKVEPPAPDVPRASAPIPEDRTAAEIADAHYGRGSELPDPPGLNEAVAAEVARVTGGDAEAAAALGARDIERITAQQRSKLTGVPEVPIRPAIRTEAGLMVDGDHHVEALDHLLKLPGVTPEVLAGSEEGYLTNMRRFVNNDEAEQLLGLSSSPAAAASSAAPDAASAAQPPAIRRATSIGDLDPSLIRAMADAWATQGTKGLAKLFARGASSAVEGASTGVRLGVQAGGSISAGALLPVAVTPSVGAHGDEEKKRLLWALGALAVIGAITHDTHINPEALLRPAKLRKVSGVSVRLIEDGAGGFTINPWTGQRLTKGYAVGLGTRGGREVIVDALDPKGVKEALEANLHFFSDPSVALGAWKNPATGKFHIEASRVHPTLGLAVEDGLRGFQEAVGDLSAYARGEPGDITLRPGELPDPGLVPRRSQLDVQREFSPGEPFNFRVKGATEAAVRQVAGDAWADARAAYTRYGASAEWYRRSIRDMMDTARREAPDLADPANEGVFKALLAVTSQNAGPDTNYHNTIEIWKERALHGFSLFDRSQGSVPVEVAKNGQPRYLGDLRPNVKGNTAMNGMEQKLQLLDQLVRERGSQGTVDYLMSVTGEGGRPHYVAEDVLGPKQGAFFLNMMGVSDVATVDRWALRTWYRWAHYLRTEPGEYNKPVLKSTPTEPERRAIEQTFRQIARRLSDETGQPVDAMDVQAMLWDYEQDLFARAGARETQGGGTFADAARRHLDPLGPGAGPDEGVAPEGVGLADRLDAAHGEGPRGVAERLAAPYGAGAGEEPPGAGAGAGTGRAGAARGAGAGTAPGHPDGALGADTGPDAGPRDAHDLVNPINPHAATEEKVRQLQQLSAENAPRVSAMAEAIDEALGTASSVSFKLPERIAAKAERPSIRAVKPWHDVEHIRDALRFKTVLDDIGQLPRALETIRAHGGTIVKLDVGKLLQPKEWGWRFVGADIRMPNGQLVEWYAPLKEVEAAKRAGNHAIFERWRSRDVRSLSRDEYLAMRRDQRISVRRYEEGFRAALDRTGLNPATLREAWPEVEARLQRAAGLPEEARAAAASARSRSASSPVTGDQSSFSSSAEGMNRRNAASPVAQRPPMRNEGQFSDQTSTSPVRSLTDTESGAPLSSTSRAESTGASGGEGEGRAVPAGNLTGGAQGVKESARSPYEGERSEPPRGPLTAREQNTLARLQGMEHDGERLSAAERRTLLALSKRAAGERRLTAHLIDAHQTETPEFKRWFGKSTMVDPSGKPAVLWHETARSNEKSLLEEGFDLARKGAGSMDSMMPIGAYLKPEDNVLHIAGYNTPTEQLPVYARVERPLHVRDRAEFRAWLEKDPEYTRLSELQTRAWDKAMRDNPMVVFLGPAGLRPEQVPVIEAAAGATRQRVTALLKEKGYDALIMERDQGSDNRWVKTIIALDPTQVKSADRNVGTFSPTNPSLIHEPAGNPYAETLGLPAIETRDGRRFEGPMHIFALQKAQAAGALPANVTGREYKVGWMTSTGRFVSRAEATRMQQRAGGRVGRDRATGQPRLDAQDLISPAQARRIKPREVTAGARGPMKTREPGVPLTRSEQLVRSADHADVAHGGEAAASATADRILNSPSAKFADASYRMSIGSADRIANIRAATGKRAVVDMRGHVIQGPGDVRALLEPFRDPKAEHFHVMLADDAGTLKSHTTETSGTIDQVSLAKTDAEMDAWLDRIGKRAKRAGATKVYLGHNHPSGVAKPSQADIDLTGYAAHYLKKNFGLELAGHYIIDHTKGTWLTVRALDGHAVDFDGEVHRLPDSLDATDYTDAAVSVKDPRVIAELAAQHKGKRPVTLLYLDTQGRAVAAEPHRLEALDRLDRWIGQRMKAHGAAQAIIATDHATDPTAYERAIQAVQRARQMEPESYAHNVFDVVNTRPYSPPEIVRPGATVDYNRGVVIESAHFQNKLGWSTRADNTPVARRYRETGMPVYEKTGRELTETGDRLRAIRSRLAGITDEQIAEPVVKGLRTGQMYGAEGGTHVRAMTRAAKAGDPITSNTAQEFMDAQGFATTTGRFVSRAEALEIAYGAGQISKREYQKIRDLWGGQLGSEDIPSERRRPAPEGAVKEPGASPYAVDPVSHFGTTEDVREAGFLLPDGKMLDFSGKREGGPAGRRTLDHSEISDVAPLREFIAGGNVRFSVFSNGIAVDASAPLTAAQTSRVAEAVRKTGQPLILEGFGARGKLLHSETIERPSAADVPWAVAKLNRALASPRATHSLAPSPRALVREPGASPYAERLKDTSIRQLLGELKARVSSGDTELRTPRRKSVLDDEALLPATEEVVDRLWPRLSKVFERRSLFQRESSAALYRRPAGLPKAASRPPTREMVGAWLERNPPKLALEYLKATKGDMAVARWRMREDARAMLAFGDEARALGGADRAIPDTLAEARGWLHALAGDERTVVADQRQPGYDPKVLAAFDAAEAELGMMPPDDVMAVRESFEAPYGRSAFTGSSREESRPPYDTLPHDGDHPGAFQPLPEKKRPAGDGDYFSEIAPPVAAPLATAPGPFGQAVSDLQEHSGKGRLRLKDLTIDTEKAAEIARTTGERADMNIDRLRERWTGQHSGLAEGVREGAKGLARRVTGSAIAGGVSGALTGEPEDEGKRFLAGASLGALGALLLSRYAGAAGRGASDELARLAEGGFKGVEGASGAPRAIAAGIPDRVLPVEPDVATAARSVPVGEPPRAGAPDALTKGYLNYAKFGASEGPLAKTVQARIAERVEELRAAGEVDKGYQSFATQDAKRRAMVRKLVADPLAIDQSKLKKLDGYQIGALRDVVAENTAILEATSRAVESGALAGDELEAALKTIDTAQQSTDEALGAIVRETARLARGLGYLRQVAHLSTDPDYWLLTAKRMLGERPMPDEVMTQVRRLAKEAAEACVGAA